MKFLRTAAGLLKGRWQMPAALVAVIAAGVVVLRLVPQKLKPEPDSLMAQVLMLAQAGAAAETIDSATGLLSLDPPLPARHQALLHDLLAEQLLRRESARLRPDPQAARQIWEHDQAAERLGIPRAASALLRMAQASEWLRARRQAVETYRRALDADPTAAARRVALKSLVRLLSGNDLAADERRAYLRRLLTDESVTPGYTAWALLQSVQDALDSDDPAAAQSLVERCGDRVRSSDLRGYVEYMTGLILVHQKRYAEAEPIAAWIDDWLKNNQRDESRSDECGHLPAMNRMLVAQIRFGQGRGPEALDACDRVLGLIGAQFAFPINQVDLFIVASDGRGRAQALLDRHDAARDGLQRTIDTLRTKASDPLPGLLRLRRTLLDLANDREVAHDLETAVDYAILAVGALGQDGATDDRAAAPPQADVLERAARLCDAAAATVPSHERQRDLRKRAGRHFENAAELVALDEPRFATLLWSASQAYDQAGQLSNAQRTLRRFVEGRSFDPRLPKALLQLGQTCEASGRPKEALAWYGRTVDEFPKLEEAARARLRSAECLWSMNPEFADEAERLLEGVLATEGITPQAAVYRDALYSLCDLLYCRDRHADLIGRLEAFISLYPQDPDLLSARFMLAHAYRRSAAALRDDPPAGATPAEANDASRTRFRRAAALFDDVLHSLPPTPSSAAAETGGGAAETTDATSGSVSDDAARTARLYERLALFSRGDCLFELNEPEDLQEALATYRQIAARFEGEPAALSAQVQMANIYLRLGKPVEATRALERARWLLGGVPDQAFAQQGDGQSRADWQKYLNTVLDSHLFAELLARMN